MMPLQRSPPNSQHSSTSDLSEAGQGSTNTQRKRKQPDCDLTQAFQSFTQEMRVTLTNINDNVSSVKSEVDKVNISVSDIRKEIIAIRTEQKSLREDLSDVTGKQTKMSLDIQNVQTCVDFSAIQHEALSQRISDLETLAQRDLQSLDIVSSLEVKIDSLEQQARQCNIEISNLPEKRGENLLSIVESIGSLIKFNIREEDIVAIHRVPQAQSQSSRPKNIIVKLTSRIKRDNILSAYRLSKGISTDQLGQPGATPKKIYLNEHLTLKNKHLFRETREAARNCNHKYVWIKHGAILVRETDTSAAFTIRSHKDIEKIKRKSTANKS